MDKISDLVTGNPMVVKMIVGFNRSVVQNTELAVTTKVSGSSKNVYKFEMFGYSGISEPGVA